jgi:hypothetical protein
MDALEPLETLDPMPRRDTQCPRPRTSASSAPPDRLDPLDLKDPRDLPETPEPPETRDLLDAPDLREPPDPLDHLESLERMDSPDKPDLPDKFAPCHRHPDPQELQETPESRDPPDPMDALETPELLASLDPKETLDRTEPPETRDRLESPETPEMLVSRDLATTALPHEQPPDIRWFSNGPSSRVFMDALFWVFHLHQRSSSPTLVTLVSVFLSPSPLFVIARRFGVDCRPTLSHLAVSPRLSLSNFGTGVNY